MSNEVTNEIVLENQKEGNPQSEWDLSGPGSSNIEGFTTDISVNRGNTVDFKINTDTADYRIDIYRLGYYGGDGARLVASIDHQNESAIIQPAPLTDATTGLVDAGNWQVTDSWNMPADAVSGVYIAKLVREDGTFGENHIPFIVRNDEGHSDIVFQTSDTTWQAYNNWGGHSLYDGSVAVSYNRPFTTRGRGDNWVFGEEYPAIRWLEANGYDVSYIAGVDPARSGTELLEHKVFLSVGHDEYWSGEQRANVEAARDAGVNLAFWSGNEVYWKTEWLPSIDSSSTDYRTLVTYKETQSGKINPNGVWTGTWGDPSAPQGVTPQNALTGSIFTVNGHFGSIEIPYEFTQLRFWRDTNVASTQPGQTATLPPAYLGPEWNEDIDNGFRPAGLIRLSSTEYLVGQHLENFDINQFAVGDAVHSLTLYRAQSGALVFSAGTQYWSWALDDHHDPDLRWTGGTPPPDPNIQQAMVNLFADMGVQPASLQSHLMAATQSTDTAPPAAIISELEVQFAGANMNIALAGSAADAGGGQVAGIEISFDGGSSWHPATGAGSWTYSANSATAPELSAWAIDDSLNVGTSDSVPMNVVVRAIEDATGAIASARASAQLDSLNSQPWSVVWNNYDTAGGWGMQTIEYDDGTRAVAHLDALNNQPWWLTWDNYDAAGNVYGGSIEYDDGTRAVTRLDPLNNQPWSVVVDSFDMTGWLLQTIQYDNSRSAVAQLDPMNKQPWTLLWDDYDASGGHEMQTADYDDGTRVITKFDPHNTQPWSLVWDNYDVAGSWQLQTIDYDDGRQAVAHLDPVGNQPWSLVWNSYDAAGRWYEQVLDYDDGGQAIAQLDPLNAQPWSLVWDNFDATGNVHGQTVVYDDGTQTVTKIDPLNTQPWSLILDNHDRVGWQMQTIEYDDGTRAVAQLDPLNMQDWYSDNFIYDANNNIAEHYQVLDDGQIRTFPADTETLMA